LSLGLRSDQQAAGQREHYALHRIPLEDFYFRASVRDSGESFCVKLRDLVDLRARGEAP
jgi:hypothetical protein